MPASSDREGQADTTDKRNQFGTFRYRQQFEREPPIMVNGLVNQEQELDVVATQDVF